MSRKKDRVAADLAGRGMLTPGVRVTNTKEKRKLTYEVQKVDRKAREVVLMSCNHHRAWGTVIIRPKFETMAKKFKRVEQASSPTPSRALFSPVHQLALEDGGKTW